MPSAINSKVILETLLEMDTPVTIHELTRLVSAHYPNERVTDLNRLVKRALEDGMRYGFVQNDDIYYNPTNDAAEKLKLIQFDGAETASVVSGEQPTTKKEKKPEPQSAPKDNDGYYEDEDERSCNQNSSCCDELAHKQVPDSRAVGSAPLRPDRPNAKNSNSQQPPQHQHQQLQHQHQPKQQPQRRRAASAHRTKTVAAAQRQTPPPTRYDRSPVKPSTVEQAQQVEAKRKDENPTKESGPDASQKTDMDTKCGHAVECPTCHRRIYRKRRASEARSRSSHLNNDAARRSRSRNARSPGRAAAARTSARSNAPSRSARRQR